MDNSIDEKILIIKKCNNEYSKFVNRVIDAYKKRNAEFNNKKNNTRIIIKTDDVNVYENRVDLDKIWAKPYFYTRMYLRFNTLTKIIEETSIETLKNNTNKILKKAIYNGAKPHFIKVENETDIVEFLKILNNKYKGDKNVVENITFVASNIDEETIFKVEQINKAIEIMKIEDTQERYSQIYDEIINYINTDFLNNNYCDFTDNKCLAQRHMRVFPLSFKDGCCYRNLSKCKALKDGKCNINCMACRLFSCPHLTKMGIGYYARDFVLLKVFLEDKQIKHLVYDFYMPKKVVLDRMINEIS